jgi:hypothetical protein
MEDNNRNLDTLKRHCKVCVELVVKTKIPGKKLFSDENGKMWSGKVCPKCHIKDINKRNKAKRRLKKTSSSDPSSLQ